MITLLHFKRGNLVYSAIHTNHGSNLRSIIYYLEKTVGEIEAEYFSHLFICSYCNLHVDSVPLIPVFITYSFRHLILVIPNE